MMKLTPHEILTHLGVHVPHDGLEINPDDTYLHATFLSLLGEQMSVGAISEDALTLLHIGLRGAHNGPSAHVPEPTREALEQLRTTLRVIQKNSLGRCDPAKTEEDQHFDAMLADAENDLRAEGERVYRITHHYDIGNQDVYVEHPTGEVDGRRVALYLWFKACDWFGHAALISNLGIASAMVAFYGFRHCAIHPFSTTVDMYSDAEGFPGYEELMNDASLHRDELREALAPHVA